MDLISISKPSLVFLFFTYFTIILFRETGPEKHWFFLVVAAFAFSFHEGIKIPQFMGLLETDTVFLLTGLGHIIGGLSLAYTAFGLYRSMKKIRMKMNKELSER
jgi:hypothetical protein